MGGRVISNLAAQDCGRISLKKFLDYYLSTNIFFSADCDLTIVLSGVANQGIFDHGKTEILKANASKGLLQ